MCTNNGKSFLNFSAGTEVPLQGIFSDIIALLQIKFAHRVYTCMQSLWIYLHMEYTTLSTFWCFRECYNPENISPDLNGREHCRYLWLRKHIFGRQSAPVCVYSHVCFLNQLCKTNDLGHIRGPSVFYISSVLLR